MFGKFIVIACFALVMCGLCAHFFPGSTGHAFNLGSFGVTWMMLIGVVAFWGGLRLVGKH